MAKVTIRHYSDYRDLLTGVTFTPQKRLRSEIFPDVDESDGPIMVGVAEVDDAEAIARFKANPQAFLVEGTPAAKPSVKSAAKPSAAKPKK